jgi:hypothetical protein
MPSQLSPILPIELSGSRIDWLPRLKLGGGISVVATVAAITGKQASKGGRRGMSGRLTSTGKLATTGNLASAGPLAAKGRRRGVSGRLASTGKQAPEGGKPAAIGRRAWCGAVGIVGRRVGYGSLARNGPIHCPPRQRDPCWVIRSGSQCGSGRHDRRRGRIGRLQGLHLDSPLDWYGRGSIGRSAGCWPQARSSTGSGRRRRDARRDAVDMSGHRF